MNLANYMNQHKGIAMEINSIRQLVTMNKIEENASEIAAHVNNLSGKLKIHLSNEDKFLYPNLINSKNNEVTTIAERYQKEMGGLAEQFENYKNKYNTKTKIMENKNSVVIETNTILDVIEKRVNREELELYKLID